MGGVWATSARFSLREREGEEVRGERGRRGREEGGFASTPAGEGRVMEMGPIGETRATGGWKNMHASINRAQVLKTTPIRCLFSL